MKKHPYNLRFYKHLIERVDRVAGEGNRTAFIEAAIDERLARFESMPRFECPVPECGFTAEGEKAVCPSHGRKVVRASVGGQLPV